jgi:hypothetical protein
MSAFLTNKALGYPYTWETPRKAVAKLDDGGELVFMSDPINGVIELFSFYRNGSTGLTAEGDAQKVISTVNQAGFELLNNLNAKYFAFNLSMADASRRKLYSRIGNMIPKYVRLDDRPELANHPAIATWLADQQLKFKQASWMLFVRVDLL